jgi:UDP-N-acetylmuramoyl-tripeptide--D-alanyl-D-alanine ligase
MKRLLSYYHPKLPVFLAYMFQQVEYNPHKFMRWAVRLPDLTKVMHRQQLVWTKKARLLVGIISCFWLFYLVIIIWNLLTLPLYGLFTLFASPFMVVLLSYMIVLIGWLYYEEPRRNRAIKQASKIFEKHPGIKIAIAGSYGKTTMKEMLHTVLCEGKIVATTPGNKNVPISHAGWIRRLNGEEDLLLIEFGEGAPGDIKKLAKLTRPEYGIITGLAPNHLDEYKSLDGVAKDLLSLGNYVDDDKLFVDTSSAAIAGYNTSKFQSYSENGLLGWKVSNASTGYEGTSFTLSKGGKKIRVNSGLLGLHQVAPLALTAVLSFKLGLTIPQIEKGLAKTMPFEHRMQPRRQHGAWIIDDTYNGSLEGLRAGVRLLKELPAKRKIYITPGLVDQGRETERVHLEIGSLLAEANPDRIVLMQNSVTQYIVRGLEEGRYNGDLRIESDPLAFYTNMEHIVAAGDLVMMQNDWTDNYS